MPVNVQLRQAVWYVVALCCGRQVWMHNGSGIVSADEIAQDVAGPTSKKSGRRSHSRESERYPSNGREIPSDHQNAHDITGSDGYGHGGVGDDGDLRE